MLFKIFINFCKAIKSPSQTVDFILTIGKGHCYKAVCKITRKKVRIGKNLRLEGWLSIKGPGAVVIGDNVIIGMKVTPWTYDENAVISIGNNVYMNGTRFGCANNIVIEDDCILADCRIMDTDFHGVNPKRRDICMTSPIYIRKNVWITGNCFILKGSEIGTGSTITPNSVITTKVPPNSVFGGNPAVLLNKIL